MYVLCMYLERNYHKYYGVDSDKLYCVMYRPFHKTLPRTSAFVNWISVRFYETEIFLPAPRTR